MSIETKIFLCGALFLGGWLWSYLFIRQIMFNSLVASPLIKKMQSLREDLIAIGAQRYTVTSTVVCSFVAALLLFIVWYLCRKEWLFLAVFAAGAVIAFIMLIKMVTPRNRAMYETFCNAYCRFVPDDELRNAIFNKKTGPIRARLKEMGINESFTPEFRK